MIIGDSRSGKTNILLKLVKEQDGIDKTFLYTKDLREPKYEFLIKKHKNTGIKHLNDPNAFIECSSTIEDVYQNIDNYNLNRTEKKFNCFLCYDCRHYDK